MDFRLMAFISVARNLNFTRASKELHISQPAVSKHIQELESSYGVQLFERISNRISLTTAGKIFLRHAQSITESYRTLQLEMNLLTGNFSGTLRIGASTTIAQYLLPEMIARFIARFPDIRLTMLTGNSEQVEQALIAHNIDVGLVEGNSRHTGLRYTHFINDELVMVTSAQNRIEDEVSLSELVRLPMVLRESGSGTLEVIENALASHNIKLSQMNVLLQMGSTESIKSFLVNCPSAYAIISVAAVTKELMDNKLRIIEISKMELQREFAFITAQGLQHELADKFISFLSDNQKL